MALTTLFALTGCGDDDDGDGDDAGTAPSSADLDGRSFVATEADGHTIVAGSEITITFAGETLSVATGCNTLNGEYTVADGALTPGELAQTLMNCEDDLNAQERWVAELLASAPTIDLDDDELELTSGANSLSFDEVT